MEETTCGAAPESITFQYKFPKFKSLDIPLGRMPLDTSTLLFQIPKQLSDFNMIKVYIYFHSGAATTDGILNYEIYTQEGADKYISKFFAHSYHQEAWSFNTSNDWLPITSNLQIYVKCEANQKISGNIEGSISIIGASSA